MADDLERRVAAAFAAALTSLADGGHRTALLRQALEAERDRAAGLMRVAVVGRISTGKSTLVNALIGEERVATGSQELTFNVNRLRHGDTPGLTIHYKDGRPPVTTSLDRLESLTVRREEYAGELRGISEIVAEIGAPYLKKFELIDTPGLDSRYVEDSRNTFDFLGIDADELDRSTLRHASAADALILVLSIRGPSTVDADLLAHFLGPGFAMSTPLTTLGVLTKCEHLWQPGGPHPLERGRALAERTMGEAPGMKQRLYELTPVCSLIGQAAGTLDDNTLTSFQALAGVSRDTLFAALSMASMFCAEGSGLPLDAAERRRLWTRFGAYGIHSACEAVRDHVRTVPELRAHLMRDSGMEALRDRLAGHFGHRAALLKLDSAAERVRSMPERLAAGLGPRERSALDEAIGVIEALVVDEPGFAQLNTLRRLYAGALGFSDAQAHEIRQCAGEFGRRPADRLGLPPDTPVEELRRQAGLRHTTWLVRWQGGALSGPSREAARVVVRSYEYLLAELDGPGGVDRPG